MRERIKFINAGVSHFITFISEERSISYIEAQKIFLEIIRQDPAADAPARALTPERVEALPTPAAAALDEDHEPIEDEDSSQHLSAKFLKITSILKSDSISSTKIREIYTFFNQNPGAFQLFLEMNGQENAPKNDQFDSFLSIYREDILEEYSSFQREVLRFAFSKERFEGIQTQNDTVSEELKRSMLDFERENRIEPARLNDLMEKFIEEASMHSSGRSVQWLSARMNGSTTINGQSNDAGKAKTGWLLAEQKTREFAVKSVSLECNYLCLIHRRLTKDELKPEQTGKIRRGPAGLTGRTVAPVAQEAYSVDQAMGDYESWLRGERLACREKGKSVILTAAQAYRRLVSIHPFANGNGRVSRLVMDFVLQSEGLFPSAMGTEVLDAVFALTPRNSRKDEIFTRKVFDGVQHSYSLIN